jgi:predicted lipid carrier protein YhbT
MRDKRAKSKQRGASFLGWLVIVAAIAGVAVLGLRLIPHYIDYRTILSVVDALPADKVHTMSKAEIREALKKRFLINNIRDLKVREVIEIDRKRAVTLLVLNYEVREHLAFNVDLVIFFDRRIEYT